MIRFLDMSKKLYEYNKFYDKDWWEENKNVNDDLKLRLSLLYISEDK